jgi:hypothetical protein
MNVLRIDAAVGPEQAAKPGRVERRTRTEHSARCYAAFSRESSRQMRHHIDGIGCHDEHRLRRMLQNRRYYVPKNRRITPEQLQPRFARLLPNSRAQHDHSAACQILVSPRADFQRVCERHGMANVIGFRPGSLHVLVHEHDFAPNALQHERVRSSRANVSASNDANFHGDFLGFCLAEVRNTATIVGRPANTWIEPHQTGI